ncbi:hypothetical protein [Paenibacillus medicaginis]|uniref:Phage protein n=1 Tax=Paenibacillus medicaginis TaxID=1470560 RepID=A0ABV5BV99_9BACL
MNKQTVVTDMQQARVIINAVGEPHQSYVVDKLRSLTWNPGETEYECDAQRVIANMEKEYVLAVANVLWIEKYEQIPDYIKAYAMD